jgi:hypothetical protein
VSLSSFLIGPLSEPEVIWKIQKTGTACRVETKIKIAGLQRLVVSIA